MQQYIQSTREYCDYCSCVNRRVKPPTEPLNKASIPLDRVLTQTGQ